MSSIDTAIIKQTINLIDLAGRYTQLSREAANEYSGACPKCGGSDRFHCKHDMFFCRQCYPLENNKPHDAIAFLQWVEGKTFVDACNALTGNYQSIVTQACPAAKVEQREWNEERATNKAKSACNALLAQKNDEARAALAYLQSRGITIETAKVFKIGARLKGLPNTWDKKTSSFVYPKQPAILFPWYATDGTLKGIKYRFLTGSIYIDLNGRQRSETKTSEENSDFDNAFGWQALQGPGKTDTLIICEGELNALSLWQAGNGTIDVLSTGTESTITHLPQHVTDLAKRYKRVIVWADKGTLADSAALAIGSASMRSPVIDGYPMGADANDLLKMGDLGATLHGMLQRLAARSHATTAPQAPTTEPSTESMDDWAHQRDDRWISRWKAGLTENTPFTRRNVEAAAKRLGVTL